MLILGITILCKFIIYYLIIFIKKQSKWYAWKSVYKIWENGLLVVKFPDFENEMCIIYIR